MIRRAVLGDIDGIVRLLEQVFKIHYDLRPDLYKPNSKKYSEKELAEIIQDEKTPIFVYIGQDGSVCGYAFCELRDYSGSEGLAPIKSLYIDDLCVDEKKRGEHIGTALFEHVKSYAGKIGCYNITLCVWEGNDSARSFYNAMGMTVQKTVMETVLNKD